MLITEYDQVEQSYIVIEDILFLSDCRLKYEAISADGSPDLRWHISSNDSTYNSGTEAYGGVRRYTFEADSVELAAMWKCCLSRQIDQCKEDRRQSEHMVSIINQTSDFSWKRH